MTLEKRSNSDFERYVVEALDSMPPHILKRLSNLAIIINERPSKRQMKELSLRKKDFLFGLYEGVPQTERGSSYQSLPDKITIFKEPIEMFVKDETDLEKMIKETVWHEIAHHFGMSEEEIRERGF